MKWKEEQHVPGNGRVHRQLPGLLQRVHLDGNGSLPADGREAYGTKALHADDCLRGNLQNVGALHVAGK